MNARNSLILDTVLETIFRTAVVFSLFLLFAGHNAPGGGFVGGLVTAAALVLRYVAGGTPRIDNVARVAPRHLLGGGLFLAGLTGAGGWVWGEAFLKSTKWQADVPLLGAIKATSADRKSVV